MVAKPRYTPESDFQEVVEESLVDINLNDSTELWLIQLPERTSPDFDGQELSLDLHQDGRLGSVEGSSGKVFDMVSYSSQESDATVFVSSPAGVQIAGKIKRHVSLVQYPDPNEIKAIHTDQKKMPTSSTMFTHSQSRSRSTHSSRKRSGGEPSRFSDYSGRDSGPAQSVTTFSGSSEKSHRKKSKK